MTTGSVFPAFLKLAYQDDGSAKAEFLRNVDSTLGGAEQRMRRFSATTQEAMKQAMTAPLSRQAFDGLGIGVQQLQQQADKLHGAAVAARKLAEDYQLARVAASDFSQAAATQLGTLQQQAVKAEQASLAARHLAAGAREAATAMQRETQAAIGSTRALTSRAAANDNARMGLQQLGMQFNDMATMWSLGARPAQILGSQIGQVTHAVQLMAGGTSRLAGFLGGPWGIALTTAGIALTPLISKLFETTEAMDDVEFASSRLGDAQSILGQVMDTTTGRINNQSQALMALARAQAVAAQIESRRTMASARSAMTDLQQPTVSMTGGFGGGWGTRHELGPQADVIAAFRDGSLSMTEAERGLRSLVQTGLIAEEVYLDAAKAITDYGVAAENLKLFEGTERMLTGRGTGSDRASLLDPAKPNRSNRLSDEAKALKEATEAGQRYIEGLEEEVAKIGLGPGELRQLEIARAKDAAGTDVQRRRIEELNAAREEAISTAARQTAIEADEKALAALDKRITAITQETALMSLVGSARDKAALGLEREAFLAQAVADGVLDAEAAWQRYYEARSAQIDTQSALERDRQEAELFRQEIDHLVGSVSRLSGVGGAIGGLLGIASGNIGSIDGPLGALLNMPIGTTTDADGKLVARRIGDELRSIFAANGEFADAMTDVLKGASIGVSAGALVSTSASSQLGSAIGGSLGSELGEKFLGKGLETIAKGLGSMAGPLGAIAGGLLGGVVGGLFGSTKYGTASLSGLDSLSASGKGSGRAAGATSLGGSVQKALQNIADQLDASVGSFRVSIGTYKDSFAVSTTGRSGKLKSKYGDVTHFEDEGSAIAYAVLDAIKDGAIKGLRSGTQRLLQGNSDIERAVQDALTFEGVFDRLSAIKDPIGAAMEDLDDEFGKLKSLFTKAGATQNEWLQLEELYWLERDELVKDAMERELGTLRSFLDDLTTGNSALSLTDRRRTAVTAYDPLASRVAAGDTSAYDEFVEASRALLEIERQMFGSQSGYFNRLNEVTSLTQQALDGGTGTAFADRDSPFGDRDSNAPVVSGISTTNQLLEMMAGQTNAQLAAVNQNLGNVAALLRSNGSTLNYGRVEAGW